MRVSVDVSIPDVPVQGNRNIIISMVTLLYSSKFFLLVILPLTLARTLLLKQKFRISSAKLISDLLGNCERS